MEIPESSAARLRRMDDPSPPLARRKPPTPREPAPTDSIELSAEGRPLAGDAGLARARRIALLRARVDAGAYTVDTAEVARRMVECGEA